MRNLYKLFKIQNTKKWNKFISMFNSSSILDISLILPDHFLENYMSDIEEANKVLTEKDMSLNYIERYNNQQKIFSSLNAAKINLISYKVFKELEKNESILSNLNSFKPKNGFSNIVSYDQVKTVSGRLVNNKNSPNILTLPARCRKIFQSRWNYDGDLLYVDFKNLEPRVIRSINGKSSSDDIYSEISASLDFEVDRVIIKRGIISTLYGSSSQIEGLSKERSDAVLNATKEYFDLESILKKADVVNDIGCRNNFFGRPIWNIEETQSNKLINNYIQSTAVDIALTYFSELVEKIDKDLCKPIFIIHDALVLDVKNEYIEELKNITNKGYNCPLLGNFPVETAKLSETY